MAEHLDSIAIESTVVTSTRMRGGGGSDCVSRSRTQGLRAVDDRALGFRQVDDRASAWNAICCSAATVCFVLDGEPCVMASITTSVSVSRPARESAAAPPRW